MNVQMLLRGALAASIISCAACGDLAGAEMENVEEALDPAPAASTSSGGGVQNPPRPVSEGIPHAQPPAVFPNTEDGLPMMQLGMGFTSYWDLEQPWINVAKSNPLGWDVSNDTRFGDLIKAGAIDPDTFYPAKFPPGVEGMHGLVFRAGANHDSIRSYYAGPWVIDWEGDAGLGIGWTNPNVTKPRRQPNSMAVEFTDEVWNIVAVNRIGEGGFRNLRIYRKEHEALLDAGKIVNPEFVAYASGYKILRTMDVQSTNKNWTRKAEHLMRPDHPAWGTPDSPVWDGAAQTPRGFPFEPLFQLAVETDTALWMHVAGIIGAPDAFDNPEIYANGTNLEALARANARAIVESDEWTKVAQKLVGDLVASDYPENRRLYIEENNEVWNWANPFWWHTTYYQGVGTGLSGGQKGHRYAYGYLTARLAHEIEKALLAAGRRQAWTPVLASQHGWADMTAQALDGYRSYFVEKGMDPAPWMKMLGVSTASYYSGGLDIEASFVVAMPGETREQAWLRSIKEDPEGLARRAADHIISGPVTQVGTIPWIIAMRNEHQRLAEAAGAFFLGDYEGHSHDTPPGSLSGDPAFVAWTETFWYGAEGGRVTKAWVDALIAQNPKAIIANYAGISPPVAAPGLLAPWHDGFYGQPNERTRAFDRYLRPRKEAD